MTDGVAFLYTLVFFTLARSDDTTAGLHSRVIRGNEDGGLSYLPIGLLSHQDILTPLHLITRQHIYSVYTRRKLSN